MKMIYSVLALALLAAPVLGQPPGNKNQFIELPADQEISSKQRSVKISAKTEGAEVQWIVFGTAPGLQVQWDDIGNKSIRVYPNDVDDEILIIAYTTAGMPPKATPPVATMILVIGKDGKSKKEPQEPVEPKRSGKIAAHVTYVVDNQKHSPEIAGIINDGALRKFIYDAGIKLHPSVDVRSETVVKAKLGAVINQTGGPPCVIVQDAQGNVIGSGRMTTVQDVRNLILPHTK